MTEHDARLKAMGEEIIRNFQHKNLTLKESMNVLNALTESLAEVLVAEQLDKVRFILDITMKAANKNPLEN